MKLADDAGQKNTEISRCDTVAQNAADKNRPRPAYKVGTAAKTATYTPRIITGIIGIVDGIIVALAGFGVYFSYVGYDSESIRIYGAAIGINIVLTIGAFYIFGLYKFDAVANTNKQIPKIFGVCGTIFLLLVSLAFALKLSEEFSRVWSFASFVIETIIIYEARAHGNFLIHKWATEGKLTRRIAIVGASIQGQRLAETLQNGSEPWIRIVGFFDDRLQGDRIPDHLGNVSVAGNLDDLIERCRQDRVDEILIALPWSAEARLDDILDRLKVLPLDVRLSPDLAGLRFKNRGFEQVSGVSCLSIFEKPISDWSHLLKRIEDLLLSSIMIVLNLPLLAIIAILIRMDSPGPALFRQRRYGFNNEPFEVLKFRSMRVERPGEVGVKQATEDDPRVTKIGKFLRRSSLDELPQLFNVFMGTMSLVGPRPHAAEHNEYYDEIIHGYSSRHKVKPGITGWAQVNGARGETETPEQMKERVEYDVYYIENWSLLFDLLILLKTFTVVISQKNAY